MRTSMRFVYLLIGMLLAADTVQAALSPTDVEGATTVDAATAKRLVLVMTK